MEHNKALIIQLIQQDLKHNQLTGGLRNLGLATDMHNLEIIEIVARLMGIEKGQASDRWSNIYFSFLEQVHSCKITEQTACLKPLAEECYFLLKACLEVEGK